MYEDIVPTTIQEVDELFDDLAIEIYFGFNFKLVMMEADDSTIHSLQNLVKEAKNKRHGTQE